MRRGDRKYQKKKVCYHKKKTEIARTVSAVPAKTVLGKYVDIHYRCLDCGKTFSEVRLEGVAEET